MSGNQIDWDKLRVFSVVAELKSMTAAAQKLGESTPTVSRKVQQLEEALGCDLLHRTTRGVEPTEVGRAVQKRTNLMTDLTTAIWNDVSEIDADTIGSLRIASSDGVLSHWIARSLPDFLHKYPSMSLNVRIQSEEVSLLKDEADISFVFAEPRHRDLLSTRLGVLHYMFFASEAYIAQHGSPGSLFDLQGHNCLMHESYVNQVDSWSPRASELKRILKFTAQTNSGTVLREMCASGGGITLMPSYIAEVDSRLVPLDLPELVPIEFWLTYTPHVQRSKQGRVFIDWIRQRFSQEHSPWFRESFLHPRDWIAEQEANTSSRSAKKSA